MVIMCYAVKLDPTVFNLSNFSLSPCDLPRSVVCVCVWLHVLHLCHFLSCSLFCCVFVLDFNVNMKPLPNENDIVNNMQIFSLPLSPHTNTCNHTLNCGGFHWPDHTHAVSESVGRSNRHYNTINESCAEPLVRTKHIHTSGWVCLCSGCVSNRA